MSQVFKRILILSIAVLITSCAGMGKADLARPIIVGAVSTAVTESEELTRQDVINAIAEFKTRVDLDGNVTASEILAGIDVTFNLDRFDPRLKFALGEALAAAERAITEQGLDPEKVRATATQLLSWVELGANLAVE